MEFFVNHTTPIIISILGLTVFIYACNKLAKKLLPSTKQYIILLSEPKVSNPEIFSEEYYIEYRHLKDTVNIVRVLEVDHEVYSYLKKQKTMVTGERAVLFDDGTLVLK